jgi:hypothetical protein
VPREGIGSNDEAGAVHVLYGSSSGVTNDSSLGNKATFKEVVQLIAHTQKEFPWGNLSGHATDPHFFWPQLEAACADAPTFSCNLQRLQALMAKFGVYCEEDSLNPGECK